MDQSASVGRGMSLGGGRMVVMGARGETLSFRVIPRLLISLL